MKRETLKDKLKSSLNELKVNEELDNKKFIALHWGEYNYFTNRCFDVYLCKCRKELAPKVFKTIKSFATRIE